MANVLSQEEVDSLLKGIGEGQVETETDDPDGEGGLKRYVFGKEGGPIHLQMPALGMINERFANFSRAGLTNSVGTVIDVNMTDIDSVRYGEFCRSLPLPSSLNAFKIEPLRGHALLVLEGSLVFGFVEVLFGSKNISQMKLEGKTFTPIEVNIIGKVVALFLDNLQQAWSEIHAVNLVPTGGMENDPQFVGIAPDDMIVASRFTVDFGHFAGTMTVCLPYSTIEPIREILRSRFQGEQLEVDQRWRSFMKRRIMDMEVSLACTLGTAKISSKAVLEMKVGEVIRLDQGPKDPTVISTEGLPVFRGFPGTYNNKKAVEIVERISKE